MTKTILIVDDEESFLLSLVQGLASYEDEFRTVTARNGIAALEVLGKQKIDLLITDLKMPEMDGFSLLAAVNKSHPAMPVSVITAYCTPEIKERVQKLGAFTILEKPIDFHDFVEHVLSMLNSVSKGYIKGITLSAFVQLVEMERKTCTLRITSNGKSGFLYFQEGVLIDADNGSFDGKKAAFDIICWQDPTIEIDSICRKTDARIKAPLSFILMEGHRMRDELQVRGNGNMEAGSGADNAEHKEQEAATIAKEEKMATTREILGELAKIQGIEAVCLVARDGFLLDSIGRSGLDKEMIGAIASSGFGASDSMGRQLDKGSILISMIEFEKGPVLLAPIGDDAFLVIVADREANLGMIRLKLKKHSGELAVAAAI
jgi:predicted regulator of Ras-like GTPase activity (Roadblock/LC7/MglB family)/CheY-like chemotaxis protein